MTFSFINHETVAGQSMHFVNITLSYLMTAPLKYINKQLKQTNIITHRSIKMANMHGRAVTMTNQCEFMVTGTHPRLLIFHDDISW